MKISTNVRLLKNYRQRVWAVSCMAVMMLLASLVTNAQFNTATVNGTIAGSEYGTHTDGQNQGTSTAAVTWLMSWDATNLYVALSGTANNSTEAAVLYIDQNPIVPVNGGSNTDGSVNGFAYDRGTYNLPFRGDFVVYYKSGINFNTIYKCTQSCLGQTRANIFCNFKNCNWFIKTFYRIIS